MEGRSSLLLLFADEVLNTTKTLSDLSVEKLICVLVVSVMTVALVATLGLGFWWASLLGVDIVDLASSFLFALPSKNGLLILLSFFSTCLIFPKQIASFAGFSKQYFLL